MSFYSEGSVGMFGSDLFNRSRHALSATLMRWTFIFGGCTLCVLAESPVFAQHPRIIPFQGVLTSQNGDPITSPTCKVQFKMFNEPVGGTEVWTGEVHTLSVRDGLVNTMLGTKNTITSGTFLDRSGASVKPVTAAAYLEMTIDTNGDGTIGDADTPMMPRQAVLPAVLAFDAANAGTLEGKQWREYFNDWEDPPNAKVKNADKWDNVDTTNVFVSPQPTSTTLFVKEAAHTLRADSAQHSDDGNPIGSIIAFHSFGGRVPVPSGWQICDGGVINDPESPLNGLTSPNLLGSFLKGAVNSGVTGGGNSTGNRDGGTDLNAHKHETCWSNIPSRQLCDNAPWGTGGTQSYCSGCNATVSVSGTITRSLCSPPYQIDLNAHTHTLDPKHFTVMYIVRTR